MPQKFTLLVIVVALLVNIVRCGPLPKKTESTTSAADHDSTKNPDGEATTPAKAPADNKDDAPKAEAVRDGTSHKNGAVDEENGASLEDFEDNKLSSKEEALLDEKLQLEAEAVRDIKSKNDADAAEDKKNDESLEDVEEDEDDAQLPDADAVRDETSLDNADSELPEAEAVRDETTLDDANSALDDKDDTELPEAEAVRDGTSLDDADAALDDEDDETLEDLEDDSEVQPEAEAVREGSPLQYGEYGEEEYSEDSPDSKVAKAKAAFLNESIAKAIANAKAKALPNAKAVEDEDYLQDEYADRPNKPLRKILPQKAVVDIRKHLRRSAHHREESEKFFVKVAQLLVKNGFIVETAKTDYDYDMAKKN